MTNFNLPDGSQPPAMKALGSPKAPPMANLFAQHNPYNPESGGGKGWDAYKSWLGKEGFKKFQTQLCNQISQQMARDKERHKKASEQLKRSETGEDLYD